jgi:hypothetical protein
MRIVSRVLRALLATLVALAALAFSSRAEAAVPMCSEDGRSIAAPPIMRPKSGLVLESRGDCERLRAMLTRSHAGDHQRGGAVEAGDAPLRAVPVRAPVPESPYLERSSVTEELGQVRPGLTLGVFRPPRR